MSMLDTIERFSEDLKAEFPQIQVELAAFPSGAAMLDVRRQGRLFVMAFTAKGGFGVDEVEDGDAFDSGYRFVSQDFDCAAAELRRLLRAG